MFACIFALVPVEDEGLGCLGCEVECLNPAVLHSRLEVTAPGVVAFAGIVVDLDGSATEGVGLESSYYGSGIFSTGDIDETVGWVTAGERIDGHV